MYTWLLLWSSAWRGNGSKCFLDDIIISCKDATWLTGSIKGSIEDRGINFLQTEGTVSHANNSCSYKAEADMGGITGTFRYTSLVLSLVISLYLYACETWTFAAMLEKRFQPMEMSCCRRIPVILYRYNKVCPFDEFPSTFDKRRLRWYGHAFCSYVRPCQESTPGEMWMEHEGESDSRRDWKV